MKLWLKNELKIVNLSQDIKKYPKRMEAGKIYTFEYDPKLAHILSYYDKHPIVLSLGPSRKYKDLDLAINLNFLPPKYKLVLLSKIWKFYSRKMKKVFDKNAAIADTGKTPSPIKELPLNFWYDVAKKLVPKQLGFALRSYYVQRRTKTIVLSYNKWPEIALLDLQDMEGISLAKVYKLYQQWLRDNGGPGK